MCPAASRGLHPYPPLCFTPSDGSCLQELTSEAASSGESALQNHTQFAEQLWDQTAVILERVAVGLESTDQLVNFFKGRKKAEEEAAKQMRMMCIVSRCACPGPRGSTRGSPHAGR